MGEHGRRTPVWRTVLGALLAVLAGLAAPASVVASWAHSQVSDTEAFVARYAPVVRSGPVQHVVTAGLTDAITGQLGMGDNRLVTRAVSRVVGEFVAGDTFEAAATASLRLAHGELAAMLTGEPGRLQVTDGDVQLRLAPFAEAIKQRLIEAGVPLVDRLPEVSGGITLLRIDPRLLPALQLGYRALSAAAGWLPWLTLALACAVLWVWPNRRRALIGVGLAIALGAAAVWLVVAAVVGQVTTGLDVSLAPVAGELAWAALSPMAEPALALIVSAGFLATLSWLSLPSRSRREPGATGHGAAGPG